MSHVPNSKKKRITKIKVVGDKHRRANTFGSSIEKQKEDKHKPTPDWDLGWMDDDDKKSVIGKIT
jgi:hypothetical protein